MSDPTLCIARQTAVWFYNSLSYFDSTLFPAMYEYEVTPEELSKSGEIVIKSGKTLIEIKELLYKATNGEANEFSKYITKVGVPSSRYVTFASCCLGVIMAIMIWLFFKSFGDYELFTSGTFRKFIPRRKWKTGSPRRGKGRGYID